MIYFLYSETPFERPPRERPPLCKKPFGNVNLKINVLISSPWWEATPLERPLFWCKTGGLTRGVPLYIKINWFACRTNDPGKEMKNCSLICHRGSLVPEGPPLCRPITRRNDGGRRVRPLTAMIIIPFILTRADRCRKSRPRLERKPS